MKKLVGISLFIFWAAVTATLTAGLIFYQNNKVTALPQAAESPLPNSPASSELVLNLREVSKHNSANDCWLIINNKIYAVSNYLNAHPGGTGTIIPYCGGDATIAFETKGGGGTHSNYANSLLGNYLVGTLNQAMSRQQIQQNIQQINSTPPPPRRRGNYEDD